MRNLAGLLGLSLLVAACSAPAGATPTPTPHVAPTDAPILGTGLITFGTAYDPDSLSITKPKSTFQTTVKRIAWSASLTFIIASLRSSGTEKIVVRTEVDVSNPTFDTLANKANLVFLVDRKPGTYVMRYLRGTDILAEGRFRLVE